LQVTEILPQENPHSEAGRYTTTTTTTTTTIHTPTSRQQQVKMDGHTKEQARA
jgi:hypothetical protein